MTYKEFKDLSPKEFLFATLFETLELFYKVCVVGLIVTAIATLAGGKVEKSASSSVSQDGKTTKKEWKSNVKAEVK